MQNMNRYKIFLLVLILGLGMMIPLENGGALAQQNGDNFSDTYNVIQYQRLTLQKMVSLSKMQDFTKPEELDLSPLSAVEKNMARNLNSHWAWPEYTLDMIDSYSPFLFRTKKSREINEIKILLAVNSKGRVSGFEILGEVDKGMKERLDHIIRKLPDCKPVPGYSGYSPEQFELTIKK